MDALIRVGDRETLIKNGGRGVKFFVPYSPYPGKFYSRGYSWTGFNETQFICEAEPDGIIDRWIENKFWKGHNA